MDNEIIRPLDQEEFDEAKKAGRAEINKREALRPLTFGNGRVSKYANIFKLGDKTRHEKSFGLPNEHGGSGGSLDLHDVVPIEALEDLAKSLTHTAVLHSMETTDGVREVIELDPDEAEAQRQVDLAKLDEAEALERLESKYDK